MKFLRNYCLFSFIVLSICLATTEITLRFAFGLGHPALMQADLDTGYRFQPNQTVFRFGNKIQYNQYSQRSEPIAVEKPKGTLRLLMTGDSVLNGGSPIDQSRTITELFEAKLSASGHQSEVLNASAGSWGVGNQLGYLKKFGTFNSDAVIVQIGTSDLIQPTSTGDRIGHTANAPTHLPLLAVQEAWDRYAWMRLANIFQFNSSSSTEILPTTTTHPQQQFRQNMESFQKIVAIVRANKIPIFVLFTPNRVDVVPSPHLPAYKSEFFALLNSLGVPAIDTHATWSKLPPATSATYFRDSIHMSVVGNHAVVKSIFQQLCTTHQLRICDRQSH